MNILVSAGTSAQHLVYHWV